MTYLRAIIGAALALALLSCDKLGKDPASSNTAKPKPSLQIYSLDPDLAVIFPASKALDLAHQCARPSPVNIESVWMPSLVQVATLESKLPKVIDERLAISVGGKTGIAVHDYYRQYAGFVIDGRQAIYVNGFQESALPSEGTDWKQSPVISCGGGKLYFGVEYDVESETFANFTFNTLG